MSEPAKPRQWSAVFLDALDAIGFWPGRLGRRSGILSLSLSKSIIVALIQAPHDEPYRARIAVRAFSDADWARIDRELAARARYTAKLLSGDLPTDITGAFDDLGLPLFPRTLRDIAMDCTCPDWQVPCEHLATVCRRVAEMFDTDPFQVLAWRGRTRTALLDRLVSARSNENPAPEPGSRPLADCLDSYWGTQRTVTASSTEVAVRPDLLLDQVQPPGVVLHGRPMAELLRPVYRTITER